MEDPIWRRPGFYKEGRGWRTSPLTMDADLDWCLTCEQRIYGPSAYCSEECQLQEGFFPDEEVIVHPIHDTQWRGSDYPGILAWAADIPAGPPPGADPPPTPSSSFHSASFRPPPPNLLTPSRHVVPPSLSMAAPPPAPAQPSRPLCLSPRRHPSAASLAAASLGQTSTQDSSLATPASSHPIPILSSPNRKPSILGAAYDHVRSWVSPSPAAQMSSSPALHLQLPPQTIIPRTSTTTTTTKTTPTLPVKIAPFPASPHVYPASSVCWIAASVRPPPTQAIAVKLPHLSHRARGRTASRAAA